MFKKLKKAWEKAKGFKTLVGVGGVAAVGGATGAIDYGALANESTAVVAAVITAVGLADKFYRKWIKPFVGRKD